MTKEEKELAIKLEEEHFKTYLKTPQIKELFEELCEVVKGIDALKASKEVDLIIYRESWYVSLAKMVAEYRGPGGIKKLIEKNTLNIANYTFTIKFELGNDLEYYGVKFNRKNQ